MIAHQRHSSEQQASSKQRVADDHWIQGDAYAETASFRGPEPSDHDLQTVATLTH